MRSNPTSIKASLALALGLTGAACAFGAEPVSQPTFLPDGSVEVPAFTLPPSQYLSEEGVSALKLRSTLPSVDFNQMPDLPIEVLRAQLEQRMAPRVQAMQERYPVDIEDTTLGDVIVKIITPRDGEIDDSRVLINLHGGAFQTCWPACALLESVPIAALGGWKVVSIDYRQGPEHIFPAASEDVSAVYRELLEAYQPDDIGIFGCSAGGVLTAQATAWLQKEKLPSPGAIGIFGAAAGRIGQGDSAHTSAYIGGEFPSPGPDGEILPPSRNRSYFDGIDMNDPLVSPVASPEVLSAFPPSLIITGTRAMDLSGSVHSHFQMKKHGVDAELIVAEALGHCYMYDAALPEATDTFAMIVDFFERHLQGALPHPSRI